jgi:hypothetical protein
MKPGPDQRGSADRNVFAATFVLTFAESLLRGSADRNDDALLYGVARPRRSFAGARIGIWSPSLRSIASYRQWKRVHGRLVIGYA